MNAEGDFFKQIKDTSNDTYKATTSKDSLENAKNSWRNSGNYIWSYTG